MHVGRSELWKYLLLNHLNRSMSSVLILKITLLYSSRAAAAKKLRLYARTSRRARRQTRRQIISFIFNECVSFGPFQLLDADKVHIVGSLIGKE